MEYLYKMHPDIKEKAMRLISIYVINIGMPNFQYDYDRH